MLRRSITKSHQPNEAEEVGEEEEEEEEGVKIAFLSIPNEREKSTNFLKKVSYS